MSGKTTSCQFSLYPLRKEHIGEILEEAIQEISNLPLTYQMGAMSTHIAGDEEQIFQALKLAFHRAAAYGDTVLVAIVSNACEG
ncbi:MAG: thiamine-binding protein [Chloroflexi bacterium]|nr:thiamine-binding protein [Chloroflexota bacterium]MCL5075689.1 thiamine-binding protein [Chloroflexota bacterium]